MGKLYTDIKPLTLLREEISSEDIHVKVNAIHRLYIITSLISPDEIVRDLLPFLESKPYTALLHEEEELLFALAEALGQISLPQAALIIPLLESMASLDETVVRDEAVRSIIKISPKITDPEIDSVLAPAALRLASAENFSARVSACSLIPITYSRSATHRERIRQKLIELSKEETPMVRRAAALQMGNFAKVIEKHVLVSELLTDLKQLAQDEQDQIRMLYIDSMVEITSLLNKD